MFCEAKRTSPSILYIPHLQQWWDTAGPALRASFFSLLDSIPSFSPILLLATCNVPPAELDPEVSGPERRAEPNTELDKCFNFRLFPSSDSVSVSGGVRGGVHGQRPHPAGEDRLLPGPHSETGGRGSALQDKIMYVSLSVESDTCQAENETKSILNVLSLPPLLPSQSLSLRRSSPWPPSLPLTTCQSRSASVWRSRRRTCCGSCASSCATSPSV